MPPIAALRSHVQYIGGVNPISVNPVLDILPKPAANLGFISALVSLTQLL